MKRAQIFAGLALLLALVLGAAWIAPAALLGLLALIGLAALGVYLYLRGSLPRLDGRQSLPGLGAPVEVVRDRDDIPHIYAQSDLDAYAALGYVHAQDRLWQMEIQRRIGHGRLAEVLGASALQTDLFLRTLGVSRAASSAWERLEPESRRLVEAYVRGINAFLRTHRGRRLPLEFTLLGYAPEEWRPEDVMVWGKMIAWNVIGRWDRKLVRAKIIAALGRERALELMPAYTPDGPLIVPDWTGARPAGQPAPETPAAPQDLGTHADVLIALNRSVESSLGLDADSAGSNSWVLAGRRTASGKPLMAHDPHLALGIPSFWYAAHISGGDLDVIGATLPGVPSFIMGHNQQIAWGTTNTEADVSDLFVEHIDEQGRAEYQGQWEPLQIIEEVVRVKGQPDTVLKVRVSRHGPLISDVIPTGGQEALAFRWIALDAEDSTFTAFRHLHRAKSWQDFTHAMSFYRAPMQNFAYSDVDGNIGHYTAGALPRRPKGDGRVPVPGWTGEYDWDGRVPFEDLPHAYNPASGYVATANNKVAPDSYPHVISNAWTPPYRVARIVELIESRPTHTFADMVAMQADILSCQARELVPLLLDTPAADAQAAAALELLRGWDFRLSGDSAAAAVYEAWLYALPAEIFTAELGPELAGDYIQYGMRSYVPILLPQVLRGGAQREALGRALSKGLASMAAQQGTPDVAAWRWDRVHHAVFPHRPFHEVPYLRPLFTRSTPNGGDTFTVNIGTVHLTNFYKQFDGVTYRQIVDLSDFDASVFLPSCGQSGHVLSPSYGRFIKGWRDVQSAPMRYSRAKVEQAAAHRMTLAP